MDFYFHARFVKRKGKGGETKDTNLENKDELYDLLIFGASGAVPLMFWFMVPKTNETRGLFSTGTAFPYNPMNQIWGGQFLFFVGWNGQSKDGKVSLFEICI